MRMTKVPHVKEYIIPEGVKSIPAYAFNYNDTIEKVIIPNTVNKIADYAFRDCVNLREIIIPESVTMMGNCVFKGCNHLGKAVLPSHWRNIPQGTFEMCTRLVDVTLPDNLEVIESLAFYRCSHIEKIDIPPTVETIQDNAFNGCLSLRDVSLPPAIKVIQEYAFFKCRKLKSPILHGEGDNEYIWIPENYQDFVYYNNVFHHCPRRTHGIVSIKEGTTRIEYASLAGCPWITEVILPASIKTVVENAFEGCTRLKQLTIADHIIPFQDESYEWKDELKRYVDLEEVCEEDDTFDLDNLFDLPDGNSF